MSKYGHYERENCCAVKKHTLIDRTTSQWLFIFSHTRFRITAVLTAVSIKILSTVHRTWLSIWICNKLARECTRNVFSTTRRRNCRPCKYVRHAHVILTDEDRDLSRSATGLPTISRRVMGSRFKPQLVPLVPLLRHCQCIPTNHPAFCLIIKQRYSLSHHKIAKSLFLCLPVMHHAYAF